MAPPVETSTDRTNVSAQEDTKEKTVPSTPTIAHHLHVKTEVLAWTKSANLRAYASTDSKANNAK